MEKTKKFIRKRFTKFITEFSTDGIDRLYFRKWNSMLHENKQSLEINYDHFKQASPILALWLGV